MAVDNLLERFVFSTIHKDFRIITMSQSGKQLTIVVHFLDVKMRGLCKKKTVSNQIF